MTFLKIIVLALFTNGYAFKRLIDSDQDVEADIRLSMLNPDTSKSSYSSVTPFSPELEVVLEWKGKSISLVLTRAGNSASRNVPIYVERKGQISKLRLLDKEEWQIYGEREHSCSFIVSQSPDDNYNMFGTFTIGSTEYMLQPSDKTHTKHTVTEIPRARGMDYSDTKHAGTHQDLAEGLKSEKHHNGIHKQKRQTGEYYIETMVVADYAVYSFWYDKAEGPGNEKNRAALLSIRQFYAFVINAVNVRYESVREQGLSITVLYKAIYIAESGDSAPFIEDNLLPVVGSANHRRRANGDIVLSNFTSWANQHLTDLAQYDHAIMFTGYDLGVTSDQDGVATEPVFNNVTTGLAYIGELCTDHRYSIVEDFFHQGAGLGAAHELAHSLGVYHDGDTSSLGSNTCDAAAGYVMSPLTTVTTEHAHNGNQFRFSSCSIQQMRTFIDKLDSEDSNCMLTMDSDGADPALAQFGEDMAGKVYPPDSQCQLTYGEQSYLYRTAYLNEGGYSTICTFLACSDPDDDQRFLQILPWEGTSCGQGKLCRGGQCVVSSDAPASSEDACLFGDLPATIPFLNETCEELLGSAENSSYCHIAYYEWACCETCGQHRADNKDTGCVYGDWAWCPRLAPWQCYDNSEEGYAIGEICCHHCIPYSTGIPGCEFGDKKGDCLLDSCSTYDVETLYECCHTCQHLITTPEPTSGIASIPAWSWSHVTLSSLLLHVWTLAWISR